MNRLTRWNGKKYILPQGAWREIADRLAAYENTGMEPWEIEKMRTEQDEGEATQKLGEIFTVSIVRHDDGRGNAPHVDPVTCNAYLYAAEVEANADNPDVIRQVGANHLVIAIFNDHWHVCSVGGYTPETGLYTKLF